MQKSEFRQSLLVTHYEDTTFEAMEANNGAPRPQFVYRQLGVEEATGGAYDAHVIRGVPDSQPPIGEHQLKAGNCHIIPPGLSHTVTGWSEDVELLEITAPGAYKTTDTVNGVEVASTTT